MKYSSLAVLLVLSLSSFAQNHSTNNHSIKGKVVDSENNQSLPYATVTITQKLLGKDSITAGVTCNLEGEFLISGKSSEIMVHASFVGYITTDVTVKLNTDIDLGTIRLLPSSKVLNEVTVTAEKDAMTMALDKRIFNVSKNITSVGGTAENLLRNIPSLTIGADGTATLRNATTTIYINGKPTQLTLAQIPANQIESVEVISNPSAKYDASASSGIVNLVLKKNREAGYTGMASIGVGNNARFDGSINIDYNKGKWNISSQYNINATKNPLNNFTHRTTRLLDGTATGYFDQNTTITLNNYFQNFRVAGDYSYNSRNIFTLAGTYVLGHYNNITDQYYFNSDENRNVTSYGTRTTQPQNTYTNAGVEFDWKHDFAKKGRALSLASGFNRNWVANNDDWRTTGVNSNDTPQTGYPENDHITGQTIGNQLIVQLDYSNPINDSTKWEWGVRSFTYIRDQQYFFNQYNGSEYLLLPTYSQNAHILETVNAIYGLYSQKLKHGLAMQAGLRVEQSALRGSSRFEPTSTFGYDYPSTSGTDLIKVLFPSFSISKKLQGEAEIGLSLSRKIGRPGWRQFFVGIQSSDRQNISIGNPALQPEFVNTAELTYSRTLGNMNWLSSVYYILEDNTIKPFVKPSATDPSVYVTSYTNVKADVRLGASNVLTIPIGKKLNILASIDAYNVSLQTDSTQRTLWAYNAKVNLTYTLPAAFTMQINASNNSKFPQLQGSRSAVRSADIALRKSFWNKKANVVFTVNDIFNSRQQIYYYDQPNSYQESMNRREVRFYKITLQLPLGRSLSSGKKKKGSKLNEPDVDFSN